MTGYTLMCFAFVIVFNTYTTNGQLPPRLQIPGAVLINRPPQQRLQRPPQSLSDASQLPPTRLRKPGPNVFPVSIPIREETEESNGGLLQLDNEPPRTNIVQAIPQSQLDDDDDEPVVRPIPFRPERPLAVARQDFPAPPPRPIIRQSLGEEPLPVRQPISQTRRVPPQQTRPAAPKPHPRPPPSEYSSNDDSRRNKNRKPPVQILRKYRTDNDDGSITWGFENEDGTFKEETIGTDCIIRGKYGYIDPEGTKREYVYESGNKCDQPEEEPEEAAPSQPNIPSRPGTLLKRPVYKV